jgi:hypothetical protein
VVPVHSAFTGLDNNCLRARCHRRRESKGGNSRGNKTKLFHPFSPLISGDRTEAGNKRSAHDADIFMNECSA